MSKDTIYREDAIKAINLRARIPHDIASAHYANMAINAICSVPSADRPTWLKTEVVEEYNGLHPDGIIKVKSNTTKREKEMFEYGYKSGMNDSDRPQGEWIEVDDSLISCKCSICGWESHMHEDDVYGMPYCPNCGAKMKGADDE